MFCVDCGSKAVEGDRFSTTCGQALRSISASESLAASVLEGPETPAEGSGPRWLATLTPTQPLNHGHSECRHPRPGVGSIRRGTVTPFDNARSQTVFRPGTVTPF